MTFFFSFCLKAAFILKVGMSILDSLDSGRLASLLTLEWLSVNYVPQILSLLKKSQVLNLYFYAI